MHAAGLVDTTWTDGPTDGPTDGLGALIGAWWCDAEAPRKGVRNDQVLSIVNRLAAAYIGSPLGQLDVAATHADIVAIAQTSVQAAELIGSIQFPADPPLIVDLKRSISGYANGAAALQAWLDGDGPASNPYGLDGQSFTAGANALAEANQRIGEDYASGTLPCDARF